MKFITKRWQITVGLLLCGIVFVAISTKVTFGVATPDPASAFVNQNTPAVHAFTVVPSDSNDLAFVARGLYVGTSGDLSIIFAGDTAAVTFKAVPAGALLPFRTRRVMSTNTTATNINAVY